MLIYYHVKVLQLISIILAFSYLNGCAVVKYYGPYEGKVVDFENGKPIEGSLVFIDFHTKLGNPGGYSSNYAGHVETFTDDRGIFDTGKFLITFRPLSLWGEANFLILKPGYQPYSYFTGQSLEEGEVGISEWGFQEIKLKKLTEEEAKSRRTCCDIHLPSVPLESLTNIRLIESIARLGASLPPYKDILKEYISVFATIEHDKYNENKYTKYEILLWKQFGEEFEKSKDKQKYLKSIQPRTPIKMLAPDTSCTQEWKNININRGSKSIYTIEKPADVNP